MSASLIIHRRDPEHPFRWFVLDGVTFEVRNAGWGNDSWAIYEAESQGLVGDDYAYLTEVRDRGPSDARAWIEDNTHCVTCGSFDGIPQDDDQWTCMRCGDETQVKPR